MQANPPSAPQSPKRLAANPPVRLRLWLAVSVALGLACWLFLIRWPLPTPPQVVLPQAAEHALPDPVIATTPVPEQQTRPRPPHRPPPQGQDAFHPPPPPPGAALSGSLQQQKRAQTMVRQLTRQMVHVAPGGPNAPVEAALANTRLYIHGWLDAITEFAPGLEQALGEEIEDMFCQNATLDDRQAIMLLGVVTHKPSMASERLFECFFNNRSGTEDVVTWQALDAWRASGLPETDAVRNLRTNAQTEQTRARFDPNNGRDPVDPLTPPELPPQPDQPPPIASESAPR